MSQTNKQQSNPFSTGGGGTNFETRIQAAFTVLMLTGRISPCLPPHPITKLKLQGSYAGFNTDDFIVFSKQPQSERESRLLAQIKHDISITFGNETFAEVIQSTWADFTDRDFNSSVDSLALITGPLSATDIKNVKPILEWARHSENEQEFLTKVDTPKFSSDAKRKKLAAFKTHLKTANGGKEVSDKQLWEFLKAFHLIGYDLDADSGSTLSLLQSLIAQYSKETVSQLWARIVGAVQEANQNAGTLTLETIPVDIRTAFDTVTSLDWSADVQKLRDHGRYILGGIKTNIGGVHIKRADLFAEFLAMTETSNFIFVSGERGSGKSSLIKNFSDYVEDRSPIFCLRIEDLDKPHLDNIFSTIGLRGSLTELEAGFALMPKKYLIIESLEKLLELNFTNAFRDLLHLLNQNQGWTVIATGRDYAYQPISFNYLQPSGINFSTLALQGFTQNQIHSLYEQVQPLQQLAKNQALQPLLKIPFFADLACRVIEAGAELKNEDGEKEFRVAVWRNVIAKEQVRTGGMPLKRKRCFIDIAIKRAKQMVYGVPEVQFDEDTLLKLEEDNLVSRNLEYGLVSPAHDVLEDWALEQYIEESYQSHSENVHTFLDAIGDEPAISRAFRLWLHQKLRYGDNINDLILSILEDENIQRYWQDEAIVALLQGDNPDEFLSLLKERLLFNDGELLKRFCFILRIACQTPDPPTLTGEKRNNLVDTLYLKPYGNGWKAIIGFLFKSRNLLSEELTPHITAVLSDWISIFNINEEIPALARQTGLLALHFLNPLKDSYRDEGDRKKLLKIIIQTSPAIPQEFLNLLIKDVFAVENRRLSYVEDLCNIAFQSFESAFLCKYFPSLVTTLALHEWLIDIYDKNLSRQWEERSSINRVENSFGVYRDKFGFSPASGARGPFQYLLRFHPKRGLDFILKLLNITARQYAHSTLDSPIRHPSELTKILPPITVEQTAVQLNDGTIVNQYCSSRLWNGYRGKSVLPDLLQSALMALENWLISYAEYSQSQEDLKWIFGYILRNTNSVMPTAVLASVATGFPAKLGRYALPLLRIPELYSMDTQRSVHDYGREINWFGLRRDVLSRVCEEERRVASQRPWRQKTLEHLAIDLQLLQLSKDDVFAAIDTIRSSALQNEGVPFLLQRIDTRNWQFEEDRENNRILIKPQELEPDLHEIQQKTQEQTELFSRFSQFYLLIKDLSNGESLADKYLKTWKEVISEARELLELLRAGKSSYTSDMHYGSIVTAAAIFLRNYSDESEDDDIRWCVELVIPSAIQNADTDNSYGNKIDIDGAAASASVLPILLDFTEDSDEKLQIKTSIATSLTHAQQYVREGAANGIREHLWDRDSEFAQKLIEDAVEYARFLQDNHRQARKTYYSMDDEERKAEALRLQEQKDSFREQMAKGMLATNFEQIKLESHRAYYLLIPCLMIPYGSTEPSHVSLLSQILKLIFQSEQAENSQSERNKDIEFHYETTHAFAHCLAKHLICLNNSEFREYIELLRIGCDTAPKFIRYLILSVSLEAERNDKNEIYWCFWQQMSQKLQDIAISLREGTSSRRGKEDRRSLLIGFLKADVEWQKIDYENQDRDIALGKNHILEFVANTGKNADVFEALAALMYHFPSIFFEEGFHILSKHQQESEKGKLLSGANAAFYLERAIQRFLQVDRPGSLPRKVHESCFILLNAVVETASSRAYYLREHLIRSRRIL